MKTIHRKKYHRVIARLRAKREAAGLTQIDVAEKMGISQPTLNKIEVCQRRLDLIEMFDYCNAIDLDFESLIAEISEEILNRQ